RLTCLHTQSVQIVPDFRIRCDAVREFFGILPEIEKLFPSTICHENVSPLLGNHHEFEIVRAGRFNHTNKILALRAFASQQFQNIYPLSHVALTSRLSRNSEQVRKADQFIPDSFLRQHRRPTQQERNTAGGLKKVLFLPAMMITQKIAMVREKADKNILRFRARFDRVEDSTETMMQVANLSVVSSL